MLFIGLSVSLFDPGKESHTARMISAVLELRIEEQVDHIDRKSRSDDTRAHAEDVRIVVQTGEACAERIRAARRENPA